jgi:hypothetical protein
MLSFKEWIKLNPKSKERKNVKSTNQGSPEVGNVDHQRQANRFDQEIKPPIIHYFPEP